MVFPSCSVWQKWRLIVWWVQTQNFSLNTWNKMWGAFNTSKFCSLCLLLSSPNFSECGAASRKDNLPDVFCVYREQICMDHVTCRKLGTLSTTQVVWILTLDKMMELVNVPSPGNVSWITNFKETFWKCCCRKQHQWNRWHNWGSNPSAVS